MAYGIGQNASYDTGNDIAHEPSSVAQWLLRAFIPHGHDDGQPWAYGSFGGTEEEPDGQESLGIGAGSGQHQDRAPDESWNN
jgi:hypothetical protein